MRKFTLFRAGLPALLLSTVLLSILDAAQASKAKAYLVYVGTYTDSTSSKGIYAFRFNPSSGELTPLGLVAETASPSFLAADRAGRYLYAVNELDHFAGKSAGSVSAFTLDRASGKLGPLNVVSTRGPGPCHLAVDHSGKLLVAANYSGGSVAAFPIGPDGRLGEASWFEQHLGKGANAERQEAPHAHCSVISPDNRFAFVADLGLDKIFGYRIDAAAGKLTPNSPETTAVSAGSGPRHFVIHQNERFAYVINEMQNTVTAFHYDKARGSLQEIQSITTLPSDFHGESSTAEVVVHPNGKFLYGSNRGSDTIAVFAIEKNTGKLTAVEHVSTQGKAPRNFAIDPSGRYLLAANQGGNNIVVFAVDSKTGKLKSTGKQVTVGAPVCVLFVPAG